MMSFWQNIDNIDKEVLAIAHDGVMPRPADLKRLKLLSLCDAIYRYGGGFSATAERCGLREPKKELTSYWANRENVDKEVLKVAVDGVMPTAPQLRRSGHQTLAGAICGAGGGYYETARRLGLQTPHRQKKGKGKDFEFVCQELKKLCPGGTLPKPKWFKENGHAWIVNAVTQHGGFYEVCRTIGVETERNKKGSWSLERIDAEIKRICEGNDGVFPGTTWLKANGHAALISQIARKGGGVREACKRVGVSPTLPARYKTIEAIDRRLKEIAIDGRFPTREQFKALGELALFTAIGKVGGGAFETCKRLGLTSTRRVPMGYFKSVRNIDKEVKALSVNGKMIRTCDVAGTALLHAIYRVGGGFEETAKRCGLTFCGEVRGPNKVRGPKGVKLGYCLADLPKDVQDTAISLATSLGVEPAEAYAQIVERLV